MTSTSDRIERNVLLRAPQEKAWNAISNANEFGDWFGMDLSGRFTPGADVSGTIKPTTVDRAVAEMQEPYKGKPVTLRVEQVDPMRVLSFRWHPYANDANVDYAKEPMTLVSFTLEPADGGTMLTVVESGFDALPPKRREQAYKANAAGWDLIVQLVAKYVASG